MAVKKKSKAASKIKKKDATSDPAGVDTVSEVKSFLLQNSPNAVFTIDSKGKCLFRNTSAESLLYHPSVEKARITDIIPEIDLNRVRSCIKDGGSYIFFIERAHRSYRMIIRGLPGRIIAGAYCSDITDMNRIEGDLLRSQNILRKVLDTDPNMIFVKDRHGRFILVNQAVAEVYGTSVEQLIGKKDSDFNPKAEEIDHFIRDDLEVISTQKEKRILEESVTDALGRSRFFSTVKRPLQLSPDEEVYILGVSNDISAVKRLQEQLAQASKMEALGQLAGGIAHDFNNLLTAILGYADILKITHSADEQITTPVSMIQVAADRAKMLTQQLLGFARQGKQQNTAIDLHALIESTLALLRRTIDPAIRIHTELSAARMYVKGDPVQLQQVIMNLAINARDAVLTSFQGKVPKIEISTHNLDENSEAFEGGIELVFADNGCGMSASVLAKIFDPFFTTKEVGKGTGLGLSTAYGIVHNHGGEILVESEVGKGTSFYLRLPCVDNQDDIVKPAPVKIIPRIGAGTILIVDDHPEVLAVASNMLETLGFKVLSCMTGHEAVKALAANKNIVDAAILDVMMPGLSGMETTSLLKKIRPDLPILLISGFVEEHERQEIIDKGYTFLRKPFELEALSKVLSELIEID